MPKAISISDIAENLGKRLYDAHNLRGDGECQELIFRWAMYGFFGRVVKDNIPVFKKLHSLLIEKGHVGKKNEFIYGDMDEGVWVEKLKKSSYRSVIASTSYSSCADANTHLYILSGDFDYPKMPSVGISLLKFICCAVWPRQIGPNSKDHIWNDHRDIKQPSIRSYRDADFDFGYGDFRDDGCIFTYEEIRKPTAEHSLRKSVDIIYSLNLLNSHLDALTE